MRGYELSINVQNFTQKELAKAELLFNVLQGGGYFILIHPVGLHQSTNATPTA